AGPSAARAKPPSRKLVTSASLPGLATRRTSSPTVTIAALLSREPPSPRPQPESKHPTAGLTRSGRETLRLRRGRRHRHSERSLLGTWIAAGDGALHGRHSWWRLCLLAQPHRVTLELRGELAPAPSLSVF